MAPSEDSDVPVWSLEVLLPLEVATARLDIGTLYEAVHDGNREIPLLAHGVIWNKESKCSATIVTTTPPEEVCMMKQLRRPRKVTTNDGGQNKRPRSSASSFAPQLPDWARKDADDFSDGEVVDADVGPVIDISRADNTTPKESHVSFGSHATRLILDS
jgi:hypothetical protein